MKKPMMILLVGVIVVFAILGVLSIANERRSYNKFASDGYILDPLTTVEADEDISQVNIINFSEGGSYRERYGTTVSLKSVSGDSKKISTAHFIHYADGSLGAFTKGVVVDATSLDAENFGYYSLTKNTIMVKGGSNYELKTKGNAITMNSFGRYLTQSTCLWLQPLPYILVRRILFLRITFRFHTLLMVLSE